jgi:putative membrane-bound dehydrogenase-like protein
MFRTLRLSLGLSLFALALVPAADKPDKPAGPLSPTEEKATFVLPRGFEAQLVACEPDVVDPVAMAFDENGRLFVAEMRGYPNEGIGKGKITSGRIKLLEDRDGDGVFETATVFAEGLRFPMGLLPWRGGLIVTVAPDIVYLEDTDGGKADRQRVLYTGFGLDNIQQMINSPTWGLDNWVHAVAGASGGTVTSAEQPKMPAVTLSGRGVRFHPEKPGSLEPTSGGGQYGLAQDAYGHWFTSTNSQHLRQIVLPDHYLRRNPLLPVSAVTIDIPDHGAACKLHRISPFEGWRVERTKRRADSPEASRFPTTELVPGGYVTSACGSAFYLADGYPAAYRGSLFVCDPANNLVHRDVLSPNGAVFTGKRGEEECEFFASTDTWCRPVYLTLGPDDALYVLDFYREVIETPLSLPPDIKAKLNLESRGRGRIWRIVHESQKKAKPRRPQLGKASPAELVKHLDDPNAWWRLTAQRLLVERQAKAAVPGLVELYRTTRSPVTRAHVLWTLDGLNDLPGSLFAQALKDTDPGLREQALRLCERRLDGTTFEQVIVKMVDDPEPRVRFQLALTLGEAPAATVSAALAGLAARDAGDPWIQTAVLSSVGESASEVLEKLLGTDGFKASPSAAQLQMLKRLAGLVGARGREEDLVRLLNRLSRVDADIAGWQAALLEGLGQGLQRSTRPGAIRLETLWDQPPAALKEAAGKARVFFEKAASVAKDEKRPLADRLAGVQLLGYGPFALLAGAAPDLLTPLAAPELQLAAVRALAQHPRPEVAKLLLAGWTGYSPTVRREAQEALFARTDRLAALLDALEQKKVQTAQLDPARLDQLRKHPDASIRNRSAKLLAGLTAPDRQKVVEEYRPALELTADVARGRGVFRKHCVTCHRLENEGHEVGPELVAVLRNKSREQLLIDIMDPSREVDPRYLNYLVNTKQGRSFTGMIAAETASSITLRRGHKEEDILLRAQIEDITSTGKSLMPDNLESNLSKQDLADLVEYLQAAGRK